MIFGDFLGSERKKVGGRSACQRHGGRCPTDHHHPTQRHLRRNAAIVLTCAGERTTFTVSQKQKDTLLLTSDKVELDATGGGFTLALQANVSVSYEIEPGADWLHPVETRGLTEHAFAYTVDENTGYDARQTDLIVRDVHNPSLADTLTVRQAYRDALIVAQREYDIPAEGGTLDFHVQTNATLEAVSSADWLTRLPDTRALRDEVLHFAVAANTGYDAREATVIIRSVNDPACADTMLIRQGYQDAIIVAQREYDVPGTGGTLDFTVQANVEVTATADVDWITQAPGTRGLVEKNLCFDIAPNEGTEARQGTITLSGGGVTQAITVRQEAYEEPDQVRVEYRTGYTWEEAHDNLPLLYYATVYRDRYYSNGEVITDTFVDTGHPVGLAPTFTPEELGVKEFSNGHIMKWNGITTQTTNDSVCTITSSAQVTDLSRIATQIGEDGYYENIGEWGNYSISKLYGSGDFISAADILTTGDWGSCSQQVGWYFTNIGYTREIELDYNDGIRVIHGVRSYRIIIQVYDQYLSIDGRRIDFLKYQPEYHFDFSTENTGGSIVHTFECRFEFMGRNFYTALINTITQL